MHVAASVFLRGMADRFMPTGEHFRRAVVARILIAMDRGVFVDEFGHRGFKGFASDVGHDPAPNITIAFNGHEHRRLGSATTPLVNFAVMRSRLAADVDLITFDGAGELRRGVNVWRHSEANASHEEQCRLVADLKLTLQFKSRNTFLGSGRTPEGVCPVTQGKAGFLIDGADPHGVLFLAIIAKPQKPLIPFASLAVHHLVDVDRSAMSAALAIGPALLLKEFDGGGFVGASKWDFLDDFRLAVFVFAFLHASNFILNAI